jgi:ABC-type dipeptide/oligopeptide/nickel transport system permease component
VSRYILRRCAQAVFVIWAVATLVFGLMFLTGDPAAMMLDADAPQEQVEAYRRTMGFDRPVPVQYLNFMANAVQGDFGISLRQRRPSMELVLERLPATLELTMSALFISVVVAVPVGIVAATRRNSLLDNASMLFALMGQAIPTFWLGLMLLIVVGGNLGWLPIAGRGTAENFLGRIEYLILPAITLSTFSMARNARMMRSSLLEVMGQDYIRTARAKGVAERNVTIFHALKNAAAPFITVVGLEFGALLGGSVVVEAIFAWPGVGRQTYAAIQAKDFPLVIASVTVLAVSYVLINLLVDLVYAWLDPRIRYS